MLALPYLFMVCSRTAKNAESVCSSRGRGEGEGGKALTTHTRVVWGRLSLRSRMHYDIHTTSFMVGDSMVMPCQPLNLPLSLSLALLHKRICNMVTVYDYWTIIRLLLVWDHYGENHHYLAYLFLWETEPTVRPAVLESAWRTGVWCSLLSLLSCQTVSVAADGGKLLPQLPKSSYKIDDMCVWNHHINTEYCIC